MDFKKSLPVLIIVVLILIAAFVFIKMLGSSSSLLKSKLQPTQVQPIVNSSDKKDVSYNCQSGKTAFEVLQANNNQVKFQGSSFGRMITGINGVSQGGGKYWLYSIDGKDATVSADAYICQGNEKIQWELK